MNKEYWNERYHRAEYAYGELPNEYFKSHIELLPVGKILLPADGEGRNGVYAATLGWDVDSFDLSEEGQKKAVALAQKLGVNIHYQVSELSEIGFAENSFDVIALIYAHFPAPVKSDYHRRLIQYLKKGGTIIFEAFSKKHLEYQQKYLQIGGPKDAATLFSVEEIQADFADFEIIEIKEEAVALSEGSFHKGVGSVVRFLGRKLQ